MLLSSDPHKIYLPLSDKAKSENIMKLYVNEKVVGSDNYSVFSFTLEYLRGLPWIYHKYKRHLCLEAFIVAKLS